ncbi:hypothetical protein K435DRAFT_972819 [Dendrothele bispora CBS 962.96]|uniref:Uncharacterized protein n=1 Tax=Dendrothele bispora (strain CBS 962.96) TaxID=1314807 RepID=A0A4S8KWJ5_DENBC|nr:hypothetical protein K435DRAFT_972819 [Dendrothele bispora CBS 962.96]
MALGARYTFTFADTVKPIQPFRLIVNLVLIRTGSEASAAFETDASLSIRYLCISGGVSASYATQKSLRRENQHAFYFFNADFLASLRDYVDSINEKALKPRVAELPTPFHGSNSDHRTKYKDFLTRSALMLSIARTGPVSNGVWLHTCSEISLMRPNPSKNVWASNTDSSVNVTASYNGIFGGNVSAGVKNETQYKTLNKGTFFVRHPDSLQAFSTVEIWSLLRDASAKELRVIGDQLENAFNHLKDHPDSSSHQGYTDNRIRVGLVCVMILRIEQD